MNRAATVLPLQQNLEPLAWAEYVAGFHTAQRQLNGGAVMAQNMIRVG